MSSSSSSFPPRDATPTRPTTRFAPSNIHHQHDRPIQGVHWSLVVVHEPDQVSAWVIYLHRYKQEAALLVLLQAVGALIIENVLTPGCQQWMAYKRTDLLGILMEIASEPDMFSSNGTSYKVRFEPVLSHFPSLELVFLSERDVRKFSSGCVGLLSTGSVLLGRKPYG